MLTLPLLLRPLLLTSPMLPRLPHPFVLFCGTPVIALFQEKFGRRPVPKDATELAAVIQSALETNGLAADFLGQGADDAAAALSVTATAEVSPVCAILGGILGQEVGQRGTEDVVALYLGCCWRRTRDTKKIFSGVLEIREGIHGCFEVLTLAGGRSRRLLESRCTDEHMLLRLRVFFFSRDSETRTFRSASNEPMIKACRPVARCT